MPNHTPHLGDIVLSNLANIIPNSPIFTQRIRTIHIYNYDIYCYTYLPSPFDHTKVIPIYKTCQLNESRKT